MEANLRTTTHRLLCLAAGIAFTPFGLPALHAEQPATAPARASLHRVAAAAQVQPDPGMPEAQSVPPPPTPPAPPYMKDDLFAGTEKFAKNATEANEVNMDPGALSLVPREHSGHARSMILNVVHHYEYDKPGMYSQADVDEFRHKLDGPDWHCSVHSRDLKSGESTDICSRNRPPDMVEQAIITVEPKELTFIHQIRRANGQGGELDLGGFPGMGMDPAESAAYFAAMSASMHAEMLASTARLRAELPGFGGNLKLFTPDLHSKEFLEHQRQMQNFKFNFKFDQKTKKQLQDLRNQLQLQSTPDTAKLFDGLNRQLGDLQLKSLPDTQKLLESLQQQLGSMRN